MELGPGVFVPAHDAQAVLDLLYEAATRRRERGIRLPTPVVELAAELARAARLERNRVSDAGTSQRTDIGNAATMNYMSTQQVADRLGITDRAVIARLNRGTLDGVKRSDGRWVIRFKGDAA